MVNTLRYETYPSYLSICIYESQMKGARKYICNALSLLPSRHLPTQS